MKTIHIFNTTLEMLDDDTSSGPSKIILEGNNRVAVAHLDCTSYSMDEDDPDFEAYNGIYSYFCVKFCVIDKGHNQIISQADRFIGYDIDNIHSSVKSRIHDIEQEINKAVYIQLYR